ncbi:hypothetical protein GJ496_009258 [Pomphorhynchus laevis]|nr:hypothetical protein GJ496_009258 [Pomphorhynchus laevis]
MELCNIKTNRFSSYAEAAQHQEENYDEVESLKIIIENQQHIITKLNNTLQELSKKLNQREVNNGIISDEAQSDEGKNNNSDEGKRNSEPDKEANRERTDKGKEVKK